MNSIYFRNFIATAGMVFISFCILSVSFVILGRSFLISENYERMEATAREITKSAALYAQDGTLDSGDLQTLTSIISQVSGNRIMLGDNEGRIVSCSDTAGDCQHIGKTIALQIVRDISEVGELDEFTDLGGFFQMKHYVFALPVTPGADAVPMGFVLVAADRSQILTAWGAFLSIFSFSAGFIIILATVMSYFSSKQQARPLQEMAQAAKRFARGDFSVRVDSPFRDDEISELTEAFNAMAESLENSEELRSEFIANISHELKTPMTTISGFADGLLDGTIPEENRSKYLETISTETKRLSRLVRRMLELSQFQYMDSNELKRQDFDVSEIIRRTLINFEGKIMSRNLDVSAQLPEKSVMVLGDADSITQVVYNLIDNAVKFATPGTTLTVSLWKQGLKAYVSIKNEGPIIPLEEQPLIFDRFHKADRSRSRDRSGIGLGLYIVKTILNNHDENITVNSGAGATEFVFTLSLKL